MGNQVSNAGGTPESKPLHRRVLSRSITAKTGSLMTQHVGDTFARYNQQELTLLDRMFQDLAKRSPDRTMSKDTFLEYFNLPGILGERLFAVFDTKQNGVIDFEEFVHGLSRYNRGNMEDKIAMLFQMYDLNGQSGVSKEELSVVLFSLVTPTTSLFYNHGNTGQNTGLIADNDNLSHVSQLTRTTVAQLVNDAFLSCDSDFSGTLSRDQFSEWVQRNPAAIEVLETVFVKHLWAGVSPDPEPDEKENKFALKASMNRSKSVPATSALSAALQSTANVGLTQQPMAAVSSMPNFKDMDLSPKATIGPFVSGLPESPNASFIKQSSDPTQTTFPSPPRITIPAPMKPLWDKLNELYLEDTYQLDFSVYACHNCLYKFYDTTHVEDPTEEKDYTKLVVFKREGPKQLQFNFCPQCGLQLECRKASNNSYLDLKSATTHTVKKVSVQIKGTLYKRGKHTGTWVSRHYVLKDKFLYSFTKESSSFPSNVLFVSGWFIKSMDDREANKGYYGIEMQPPANMEAESKNYYCKSKEQRKEWVNFLQKSACTVAIETHYKIGCVLGKGHFSVVHEGTHVSTNKRYAIKVVEKKRIDAREKEALRNEIAIMKLVKHPCIIRMVDVYEDRRNIYMVMPLVEHGDFFGRWQKKKIFSEETTRIIIWKLLDAIHYLHSLGIVHRDLKPENILCTDADDDTKIVISDFGLSKFAAPHAEMTMPCGTLAYVAPEVLQQKGYDRKVDLWSLGCIMHLLIRGILPFDGNTRDEVVERTLRKPLNLSHPRWENVSPEARDFVEKLLKKSASERIDLEKALMHDWFKPISSKYSLHQNIRLSPSNPRLFQMGGTSSMPGSPNNSFNTNSANSISYGWDTGSLANMAPGAAAVALSATFPVSNASSKSTNALPISVTVPTIVETDSTVDADTSAKTEGALSISGSASAPKQSMLSRPSIPEE